MGDDGKLYAAATHTDGSIHFNSFDKENGWTSSSTNLGAMPGTFILPSQIGYLEGEIHVVAVETDGDMWNIMYNDGRITWTNLKGTTTSAPSFLKLGDKLHLAVRGENDRLYHKYYSKSDGWSEGWNDVEGGLNSQIGMAAVGNKLHVAVRGASNYIYHKYWDESEIEETPCTDSDGGKNYGVKGKTVRGDSPGYADSCYCQIGTTSDNLGACVEGKYLGEWYCDSNGYPQMESKVYCENGCEYGRCLTVSEGTCNDPDGGKNFYVKSVVETKTPTSTGRYYDRCDSQQEGVLNEWYCDGARAAKISYKCPNGCKDDACVREVSPCRDTDTVPADDGVYGKNIYKKGTAYYDGKSYTDECNYCTGACEYPEQTDCTTCGAVKEYWCEDDEVWTTTIVCPTDYTCEEGACIRRNIPPPTVTVTIPPQPVCSDNIRMSVSQDVVPPETLVTVSVGGIYTCDADGIKITKGSCYSEDVCESEMRCYTEAVGCVHEEGVYCPAVEPQTKCYCNIRAPSSPGSHAYFACLDKNGDNDYSDYGERYGRILRVEDAESHNIVLYEGWNMISFPVDLNQPVQSFGPKNCHTVGAAWHYANGKMEKVTEAKNGEAYWIKLVSDDGEECVWKVYGEELTLEDFPRMEIGWNQIGGPSEPVKFGDITLNCDVLAGPYKWDAKTRRYVLSEWLEPGQGYWVAVTNVCSFGLEQPPQPPGGIGCPEDAMRCPDGTYVTRSPPECEFDPCPETL
jgi:hypothetical protein